MFDTSVTFFLPITRECPNTPNLIGAVQQGHGDFPISSPMFPIPSITSDLVLILAKRTILPKMKLRCYPQPIAQALAVLVQLMECIASWWGLDMPTMKSSPMRKTVFPFRPQSKYSNNMLQCNFHQTLVQDSFEDYYLLIDFFVLNN